ncbi:hypothetical protein PCASD_18068 [Puccinia coronata f. sp. avenae]|uniref:Thioredoxin domain-containing protein n=1 Tax=Puccinia coronata f. sp. avenae TaxID=200324 RepID=A0A2N5U0L2_9BASI|nr:hypothetical protein PCASD_18068 [Puccinia coronata f. sp. avenae]
MSPPAGTGQTAASDSQEWDDHREDPHAIDDDDLLAELDDKLELSGIRERRLEELRNQVAKTQRMSDDLHGRYVEIKEEKKLINITAKAKTAVVHFFHPDFERCKTMDRRLEQLSSKYFSSRFLRVDVANVPWLVDKLQIKVLPCVVGFLDGVSKERIVGFEGITGSSNKEINMTALENRLQKSGIIKEEDSHPHLGAAPSSLNSAPIRSNLASKIIRQDDRDTDDGSDWDD